MIMVIKTMQVIFKSDLSLEEVFKNLRGSLDTVIDSVIFKFFNLYSAWDWRSENINQKAIYLDK
jgi:hypothetical protein